MPHSPAIHTSLKRLENAVSRLEATLCAPVIVHSDDPALLKQRFERLEHGVADILEELQSALRTAAPARKEG